MSPRRMSLDPPTPPHGPFSPPVDTKPRPLSTQDRAAAAAITSAGRLIHRIRDDARLADALQRFEFDAVSLETGTALHASAEAAFAHCQLLLGALDASASVRDEAFIAARREFARFRRLTRALNPAGAQEGSPGPRHNLGLHEFVAHAHATYAASLTSADSVPLAAHGFGEDQLCAAITALHELISLDDLFGQRAVLAAEAIGARVRAVARLNVWVRELLEATQRAFSRLSPPTPAARRRATNRRQVSSADCHPHRPVSALISGRR